MKSTCHILSDLNEKIVSAIALKGIHNSHATLIDEAIEIALKNRNEIFTGALTAQDLFYVKVTKIQELFKVFASLGDDFLKREQSPLKVSQILLDIGTIVLVIFVSFEPRWIRSKVNYSVALFDFRRCSTKCPNSVS